MVADLRDPGGGGRSRVLIVEDERPLAASLEKGLRAEGFAPQTVFNGRDGLARARSGGWDVLICDIMLPEINGYRLCTMLREEGIWTPILVLTAKDGDLDEAEALDSGADDWLNKPFAFVVLVARLRALLRRQTVATATEVVAGELIVDLSSGRCSCAGVEVALTRRELMLAELFARRRGSVLSKSEILEQLWGPAFAGDPNIVEVYVARLRRKLDAPLGRSTIETVRGTGYRLHP